jgi:uncharacterized protein YjbJ (UPF0337 family)
MNTNQVNGRVQNDKGRVKQAAAIMTGNEKKESEGSLERTGGAIKKAIGDLKHSIAKRLDK